MKAIELFPVYKCDDYKFDRGELIIWDAKLVAMVNNIDDFNAFVYTQESGYDAIVCPALYMNETGDRVKITLFV